jgi:asparagine synthase (glutamine-hydrolysing)
MCGIAGIVRWHERPVLEGEIRDMCAVMTHRGPDDEGVYVSGGVGLGMRRLSIIGLENGRQPVSNEDGSVWVVFNGEIYNYRDLRRGLESHGHVFRTDSDTETLVHLYEELGPRLVERLRGMFAFALWDRPARRLLLARDRLGIKPLYYAERPGEVIFASEIKPILQQPQVGRSLNWASVGHLFNFLATPPDASIVDGIAKLEPAHLAVASAGQPLITQRYWDVAFEPDERASEAELIEQLRAHLDEAVALHRVSDVPVGAFLSGGIDSSAVVTTLARQTDGPLKTFSIGFDEADFSELAQAREVAAQVGADHHELVLRPDVVGIVDQLTWYLDEPFGDTSAIPTFMVSKLAAEHVKVVMTGDGGDELFAGYDRYLVEHRERLFERVPAPLRKLAAAVGRAMPEGMRGRRLLQHVALDGPSRYLDAFRLFRTEELGRLFTPGAFEEIGRHDPAAQAVRCLRRHGTDWLSAIQYCDLRTYLPLDILTKVDRMTMAHSIEARPPLLDHRLVEFAAALPARYRLRNGATKYLLKRAMRGVLPDRIIDRPKQGFAVPLGRWLRRELAPFAADLLLSPTCRARGIFDAAYVQKLLQLHAGGRDLSLPIWTMLSFEMWCRRFLDRAVEPAPAMAASA